MFERIIVPLDGSRFAEAALAPARELARAFSSRILLVRAVPPHGLPSVIPGLSTANGDGRQSEVERANDADAYLHTVAEHLTQDGYDVDLALALAAPGTAIAQAATLSHADLIVMAAHLRWKVPASPDTSAALDVLVHSRVPLLAWRVGAMEEAEGGPDVDHRPPLLARVESPLLVALDGSPLAETALPVAETLARAFGLYIVLVRAVSQPKEQAEAHQYLLRVQAELDQRGVAAISKTATGDPLSVIENAWRENYGSLVMMTSRGRLGPHGTFFGSLAARVLEEVEAPVLVLRPQQDAGSADLHAASTESAAAEGGSAPM
ncbi:MAG TPA: universal stress protein [Ktedonobacterales bacterium]|nr:universal stress protein [Ktedonobacterales bacterium]